MVTAQQRVMLGQALHRWRRQNRPISGITARSCIAGGRSYLYANGDISPCVFAPVTCGNIFDIVAGRSEYTSLRDFVQRQPVFVAIRAEQAPASDRARPCLLIDRPEVFRRICRMGGYRPAKNMPEGYLVGEIARALDAEFREHTIECPVAD